MDKRLSTAVPSLDELKKMIKQENLSPGRLTSLKLPRDLSLGGTKPKKVYTPNLNVIRNKDKNKHVSTKADRGQKRNADNSSHTCSSSRQKNKRTKFIQSEGVFSQGMGEIKRSTHHSDRGASLREHSKVAALVMPKINKSSWNVNNKKEEAELVSDLVADEESDSESDTEYDPVVLPLDLNKNNFTNVFKVKSEDVLHKIKKEEPSCESGVTVPEIVVNGHSDAPDMKTKVKLESIDAVPEFTSFTDCTKVYDEDNLAFSALQLPNSFSGKIFKDDPNDKDLDYTVRHMPEGQIGKILIRRSGKMEMIIKNTKYTLNGGASGNFVEEAMQFPGEQSIALEPSLVMLGSISEKFTLTPEWNSLFERARKNNKFYW